MYQLSRPSNGRLDYCPTARGHRVARRLYPLAAALLILVLAGCQPPGPVDQLRKDFVALRYIKAALRATVEPVDAGKATYYATRALTLASDDATVLDRAGHVYLQVGNYKRASATLQKASLQTGHPYLYELGTCLLHTGQQELGCAYLGHYLRIVKFDCEAGRIGKLGYAAQLNNVGYAYAEAGVNLDEARKLTEQAVGYAPLNAAFTDSLGWVYYKLGDLQNATFYLERAVRQSLRQPNAELHYHLGRAYTRLSRKSDAAQELAQALRIRPLYQEAARELHKLKWELAPPWYARPQKLDVA